MTNRNAPGCGQILAACVLVIIGTVGGCTVGILGATSGSEAWLLWPLGTVGGLLVGVFLAAWVLGGLDR
jgi:hypothetical protein